MGTLEILNMGNWAVIFGILIFYMHRMTHLRSGPPGCSGPIDYMSLRGAYQRRETGN